MQSRLNMVYHLRVACHGYSDCVDIMRVSLLCHAAAGNYVETKWSRAAIG